MTDRELLELAAKAASIDYRRLPDAWPNRFDDDQWDPLTNDGDALRLAVKLGLTIVIESDMVFCRNQRSDKSFREQNRDNNQYTAIRRAIVRAAAEIGKQMND